MATPNELRLFISSTFRDMQEEREHLVKKIFPEIRVLCRSRGVVFTDVDLRWGLTEEEASLGRIIRTCLEEVDKCRPYFIGMIGNRYGWVPELHDVLMDPDLLAKYPFVEDLAIDGVSVTEMEFIHGVFDVPEIDGEYAFFYRRSDDLATSDNAERLGAMIDRARATGRPFREFTDVEDLGEAVRADLVAMIDEHWPDSAAPSELDLERRAHAAFAASRTRAYIPNPLYLKAFSSWLSEGETPLVITGDSGLGKSSLVAYLTEYYHRKNPDAFVVAHYVGASPSSGTADSVMRHVIEAVNLRFGIGEDIPSKPEDLQKRFVNLLFRCEHLAEQEGIDVLIVIDAVNQLDEAGQRMSWLPAVIPPGLKLVVSTTPGDACEKLLDRGWSELNVLPLEDEGVRQSIIVRYLGEFRKGIGTEGLRRVVSNEKARSPLYLRVVAEELRLHGEHDTLDAVIDRYSAAADLLEVFELVLERMETDYGESSIGDLLSLIAASRSGLGEDDLLGLMGVSRLELSRLLFAFDYHLLQRDGLLSFFHDYLRRAVERRYLSRPDDRTARYRRLASWFEQADISVGSTLNLVHALEGLEDHDAVDRVLSDIPRFVEMMRSEVYEVLRRWAGRERSDITAIYRSALQEWERKDRTDEEREAALNAVSELYERTGAWEDAAEIAREQLVVLRRFGDRRTESRVTSRLGHFAHLQGRMAESLALTREAETIARELDDPRIIGLAVGKRGTVHAELGEYPEALACYREWEQIARASNDMQSVSYTLGNRGIIHAECGEYPEALACLREQEQIARDMGDRWNICSTVGNRGVVHSHIGEYPEALTCFMEQELIARELGDRKFVGSAMTNRGIVHAHLGEFAEALACYREDEQIARELGDRRSLGISLGNRGTVHADLGEYAEAFADVTEALEIHREIGFRYGMTYWLGAVARYLVDLYEQSGTMPPFLPRYVPEASDEEWREAALRVAREHTAECLQISRDISKPDSLLGSQIILARITAAEGDRLGAQLSLGELLDEATDDAGRADLHYWLWRLGDRDQGEEARKLYDALFAATPKWMYRNRLDELSATAA